MNEDGEIKIEAPLPRKHYHGDTVRILFVVAAILIFATKIIAPSVSFSFGALMLLILTLVIAAGITNPVQKWIHSVNMLIAIAGAVTFGWLSFSRIETSEHLFSADGLVVVTALIFLTALYYTTSTVRGFSVPHVPPDRSL